MFEILFTPHKVRNVMAWRYGNPDERLDFTELAIWERIPPEIKNVVWANADAIQVERGNDFEPSDIIAHLARPYLYEVTKVIDARLRMDPQIYLETSSRKGGTQNFRASEVVQFGYLLSAYAPYDSSINAVEGKTIEEIIARMAIVLANLGIIKDS